MKCGNYGVARRRTGLKMAATVIRNKVEGRVGGRRVMPQTDQNVRAAGGRRNEEQSVGARRVAVTAGNARAMRTGMRVKVECLRTSWLAIPAT